MLDILSLALRVSRLFGLAIDEIFQDEAAN
jgi:DNA-binding XRE family transcriptional regulator